MNLINAYKGYGITYDQIKAFFASEKEEDIKRLIGAALDLSGIKKQGQGRAVKYYGIEFEITPVGVVPKMNDHKLIDGTIDVSNCINEKAKAKVVLESDHQLSTPILFSYREHLLDIPSNRELRDFLDGGIMDTDVRIAYDRAEKKNKIYSKKVTCRYNSILIGRTKTGELSITKMFNGSPDNIEEKKFENWTLFEKYLRTLLCK